MLMVSGIGPKETLNSLGIEVLSDRPGVGQNMWVCYTARVLFAEQKSPLCSVHVNHAMYFLVGATFRILAHWCRTTYL